MDRKAQLTIKTAPLPEKVRGLLQQTGGNTYTIYINSELSDDDQAAAFLHEALHLYHDDTNRKDPADAIEQERHAEIKRLLQTLSQE